MDRGRLEAFSDGVLAIVITLMALELGRPEGTSLADLRALTPAFAAYIVSFLYVGIYWNNHHHLLKCAHSVNSSIMWSNLALLFFLSLFPFATAWWGENHLQAWPTFVYALVLLCAALSYYTLQTMIVRHEGGPESPLGRALGRDLKGRLSLVAYLLAAALAFVAPLASAAMYVAVAITWLVPDRRLAALTVTADDGT
jgi:uncharacterized membrane protein